MKIQLTEDEWYPVPEVYLEDEFNRYFMDRVVEVPDEIVAEYLETRDAFTKACAKIARFMPDR